MIKPIPKWVWKKYALLWKKFEENDFTFKEAQVVLQHLDRNTISVMFNELKKAGWLEVKLNEKDTRKRVYTLVKPSEPVERFGEGDI